MAASLPLQASRLHLPHGPGSLHTIDFVPVVVVIIPYSAIFLSGGTACLNTTLVLKVHCACPDSSIIEYPTSLCLQHIAGKQARAHL